MNRPKDAATGLPSGSSSPSTVAGQAVLLGLIGTPIKASAAPFMHEAAAQAAGLRAQYRLIDIPGADQAKLRMLLEGVRLLGFSGVNVTFPYKEAVVPLLDTLTDAAAAIGAVNTIVVHGGRLVGHNTDATGFVRAFSEVLGRPDEAPVVLIGAGGVGRAIAFAMVELGVRELRLVDSAAEKAAALAERLRGRTVSRVFASAAEALQGASGVINATPVGMLPDRGNPVPPEHIHANMWVADAVYTPLWTPLLQAARARGARVMTGRELSIHQAVDAFRLFTGCEPSREAIASAFDAVMSQRDGGR
jgi:shikimate dehydrogenase